MKDQEKFIYRMMELKEMFDQVRHDMQSSSQEIERETKRFIAHVDMIDEKGGALSQDLAEQLDKRMTEVIDELDHKLKALLENETNSLRNTVHNLMHEVQEIREKAKINHGFKNYLLSLLVGALMGAGVFYFIPTPKGGLSVAERDLMGTGKDLTLGWQYLDDTTKDAISKAVVKAKRLRQDQMAHALKEKDTKKGF